MNSIFSEINSSTCHADPFPALLVLSEALWVHCGVSHFPHIFLDGCVKPVLNLN